MYYWRRFFLIVDQAIIVATALMIATIVVATLLQVVSRYVFQAPFLWTEELARICGIWVTFLGAATVYRHGGHVAIDVFSAKFAHGARARADVLGAFLVLLFAVVVVVVGVRFIGKVPPRVTPALKMPVRLLYSAAPIGAALLGFFSLERLAGIATPEQDEEPVSC